MSDADKDIRKRIRKEKKEKRVGGQGALLCEVDAFCLKTQTSHGQPMNYILYCALYLLRRPCRRAAATLSDRLTGRAFSSALHSPPLSSGMLHSAWNISCSVALNGLSMLNPLSVSGLALGVDSADLVLSLSIASSVDPKCLPN